MGPVTVIDTAAEDTTLTEGDPFVHQRPIVDPNGVDTVYFDIEGGNRTIAPSTRTAQDTVTLRAGDLHHRPCGRDLHGPESTAVDALGNQGGTSIRQITIE